MPAGNPAGYLPNVRKARKGAAKAGLRAAPPVPPARFRPKRGSK